ncbi:MAG TPA: permease-like cell division protein FtsX [Burkholderiaceae bacterium]|nr:permease-like cell division protein FtsX [Burkholderiaceae bacterium]
MKGWLRHHRFALAVACGHLLKSPASFALNVLVVAIAFALPIAGLTLLDNIRPVSAQLAVEPEISIFLTMNTSREQANALAPAIRRVLPQQQQAGAKLEFVPREQALNALKDKSGLSDALATLGSNPLPDGYVLKLPGFQDAADAAGIDTLATQLQALPGVEAVQVDSAWVKRLAALLRLLRLSLVLLGGTLAVVVIAVIFNTIRLQVMTQREEIEVSRLVGATAAFIHRPFYYSGVLLGLCAGGVAMSAVALALQPLNQAITEFARLYASDFQLAPLGLSATLGLLAASALLGLAGAVLSVRRHLVRLA